MYEVQTYRWVLHIKGCNLLAAQLINCFCLRQNEYKLIYEFIYAAPTPHMVPAGDVYNLRSGWVAHSFISQTVPVAENRKSMCSSSNY